MGAIRAQPRRTRAKRACATKSDRQDALRATQTARAISHPYPICPEFASHAVAAQRAQAIAGLPILEVNDDAQVLAGNLLAQGLVPRTSVEDALHIALATVHGMDFLLTWNFRHINNAETKARIMVAVEAAGYECPVICSPEELGGEK